MAEVVGVFDGKWQFVDQAGLLEGLPWSWRVAPTTLRAMSFFAESGSHAILGEERIPIPLGCITTRSEWVEARLNLLAGLGVPALKLAHRLAGHFGQPWGKKPLLLGDASPQEVTAALVRHAEATGPSLVESVIGEDTPALAGAFNGELYWEMAPTSQGFWLYVEVLQPEVFGGDQAPPVKARYQSHAGWSFDIKEATPRQAHLLVQVLGLVAQ